MILETNIDDSTGEQLGFLSELLMEHGANDAFYTPIYMKKNRPANKLTVICEKNKVDELEKLIFKHSTTIGIRKREETRTVLERKKDVIETRYGPLEVKKVYLDGKERIYVEYESAKKLSLKYDLPLKTIYSLIGNDE